MHIKRLRDIKTHGSLARQGKLVSVARNLRRSGSHESGGGDVSVNWSVEQHIYKKKPDRFRSVSAASLCSELFFENQVYLYQVQVVRDLIQEMYQAMAEGISVATQELERLTKKLVKLEVEHKGS